MAGNDRNGELASASTVPLGRYMRRAACALLMLCGGLARTADAPTPAGLWQQIDDHTNNVRTLVRIDEKAGVLSGTIEKLFPNPGEDAAPRCLKCTDLRKDQPIVGMRFLTGLKHENATSRVWSDGEILDPESGTVYRSKATLSADGQTLNVRGYIGISLIGRTQTWRRAP